jgi:PncC family amidohydrolase
MSTEDLAARLKSAGLTVAVAESAAGGLIAAELTAPAGSSAWFRGGLVAYDAASKTALLGIPEDLFVEHGSVSAEAARAMAEAARRVFGADLGVGETSIAGPGGGTAAKPVGLTYVAVASASGVRVKEARLSGSREENRREAVAMAMALLEEAMS